MRTEGACLLLALAGCIGPGATLRIERSTPLPPALTAWVVAAAVRQDLSAADPLRHRGAPAMALAGGAFAVQAAVDAEGRWTMLGNGRLLPAPDLAHAAAFAPCAFLPRSAPRETSLACDLQITPRPGGAALGGGLAAKRAGALLHHIEAALDRAERLLGEGPEADAALLEVAQQAGCCHAHADLRVALLAAAAHRVAAAEPRRAAALLAQARALAPDQPALDLAAGLLLADLGQDAAARTALRDAERDCSAERRDTARSGMQELLAFRTDQAGPGLRLAMVRQLQAGRTGQSACLLQSAEAADPDPHADLELRAQLHWSRGENHAALGCLMLRMLHAPDAAEPALAGALLAADEPTLAARELMRRRWQGVAADGDGELFAALAGILGADLYERIGQDAEPASALAQVPFARPEGETDPPAWRRAAALRYGPPAGL